MTTRGITVGSWLIPESDIEERFDTSGGPGGQHANKSETAVTLRLDIAASSLPDEVKERLGRRLGDMVEVTASDTRSQWRNREIARERLTERIERALIQPKPRRKTKPPPKSNERRLAAKRSRSEVKKGRRPPDAD
ncbi:MAG TPA: alternative ribosome rescue aminoacyl-tRNA hydrolase ArfB [Acidimicrobiia bacterium]|nr:alternative ribosome rescue aminoacyl-tRNA hydrolase ArfB [Acidimicrobiia bacterium]